MTPTLVETIALALEAEQHQSFEDQAAAVIQAIQEQGLVLVPAELSGGMEDAFVNATINQWATLEGVRRGYRAMLSASPQAGGGE